MDESSPPAIPDAHLGHVGRRAPVSRGELIKGRAALAVVLLWAVHGPHRGDLVDAIHDALRARVPNAGGGWGIGLVIGTLMFVAILWPLKRCIENADGDGRRYWRWWWISAITVIAVRVTSLVLEDHDRALSGEIKQLLLDPPVGFAIVALLLASLNADPATLFSHRRRAERPRDWARTHSVIPIVAGYIIALIAKDLWFPFHSRWDSAEPVVKEDFFHETLAFIPLMLMALGFEAKFFNRSRRTAVPDSVLRAAPIATGLLMIAAILLAGSMLTYDRNALWAEWHMYEAFTVSVQASATALAAVVWNLVVPPPQE
jgi:hypothetical protein